MTDSYFDTIDLILYKGLGPGSIHSLAFSVKRKLQLKLIILNCELRISCLLFSCLMLVEISRVSVSTCREDFSEICLRRL